MKRGSEEMDTNEADMIIEESSTWGSKRPKEANEPLEFVFLSSDLHSEVESQNKKKSLQDHAMELDDNIEGLIRVTEDSMNVNLHTATCNFVKKPGHIYHLYERPSGQKYLSMLSPQDWLNKAPHKFLGSWFLGPDQSWTPAEEFERADFLTKLYYLTGTSAERERLKFEGAAF